MMNKELFIKRWGKNITGVDKELCNLDFDGVINEYLEEYLEFLLDEGYCDSDVYPQSNDISTIDRFLMIKRIKG